jgi:hypothetical protein
VRRSHGIDRPATAGHRHGRGRTLAAARVACGRRARVTHAPTGALDVDEGIRLGVSVPPAFSTPSGLRTVPRPHATRAPRGVTSHSY